jgi:hypothetical protein
MQAPECAGADYCFDRPTIPRRTRALATEERPAGTPVRPLLCHVCSSRVGCVAITAGDQRIVGFPQPAAAHGRPGARRAPLPRKDEDRKCNAVNPGNMRLAILGKARVTTLLGIVTDGVALGQHGEDSGTAPRSGRAAGPGRDVSGERGSGRSCRSIGSGRLRANGVCRPVSSRGAVGCG